MRVLVKGALGLAFSSLLIPFISFAQQPSGSAAGGVNPTNPSIGPPSSVDDRTYWPKTDVYDPVNLLGNFVYITAGDKPEMALAGYFRPGDKKIITKFLAVAPSAVRDYKKDDKISVGIPGLASFDYNGGDSLHVEIADISESYWDGAAKSVCNYWKDMSSFRAWKPGDRIVFVTHVLVSRSSYEAGTMQDAKAQIGVGRFFSGQGGTSRSTTNQRIVPALAIDGPPFTLTQERIDHGCTSSGRRERYFSGKVTDSGIGHILVAPSTENAKAVLLK